MPTALTYRHLVEPILKVEEGPALVSSLLGKQVLNYRKREFAAAELRVQVPIINDKSPFLSARVWHKKLRLTQCDWPGTDQPFS